ncbi:MAG: chitinase [Bacteroidota bacterium]|nr:chitinase [Bacteroidota bacterium]
MKHIVLILLVFISMNAYSQSTLPPLEPLGFSDNRSWKSSLPKLLNEAKWNELFPNRSGHGKFNLKKNAPDFYSFRAFVAAARFFPEFLSGSRTSQKRELAAFLANIAQETSGGWANAPGGYFTWGLFFVEETEGSATNRYANFTKKNYPPVPGKSYYGRGPKQLSWNYNYGQFSEAWYGTKDSLLLHPEKLAQDPVLSFASAIWFWMTPQFPKPSCHDIMTGKWNPTPNDLLKGRVPGFGATVNVINGGVECGAGTDLEKTAYRYKYYRYFCTYFHVSPGENISCSNQKPFGQ